MEPGVALPADHLVAVVLLGKQPQGRFDHTAAETQNLEKRIIKIYKGHLRKKRWQDLEEIQVFLILILILIIHLFSILNHSVTKIKMTE